jgi:hypothetical protein
MERKKPSPGRGSRPLWTCPRCRLEFVTRNLWHSCGRATLAEWKGRMGPRALLLYEKLESLISSCGPYRVSPAKTRITFMGRVRFAGIARLSEEGMTCSFALPHPLRSRRFTRVAEVAPGWWAHELRVVDVSELDAQVEAWLRRSYRLMGQQERLKAKPARRRRGRESAGRHG